MADISASSWSETDGSNNSSAPTGAPEGMAPSGLNDVLRAHQGAVKRFYNHINATGTTGGTATELAVVVSGSINASSTREHPLASRAARRATAWDFFRAMGRETLTRVAALWAGFMRLMSFKQ